MLFTNRQVHAHAQHPVLRQVLHVSVTAMQNSLYQMQPAWQLPRYPYGDSIDKSGLNEAAMARPAHQQGTLLLVLLQMACQLLHAGWSEMSADAQQASAVRSRHM
jgi:hypothetical protein